MREYPMYASLRLQNTGQTTIKPGTGAVVHSAFSGYTNPQSAYRLVRSQPKSMRHKFHLPYDCDFRICKAMPSFSNIAVFRYRKGTMPEADRIYSYSSSGNVPTMWTPPAAPPELKDGPLINNCYQAIKDMKVDLATSLVEFRQTADLVSNSVKRLDNALSLITRKDFSKAARVLRMRKPKGVSRSKHAADNFLAYQFGILQLVSDVNGSLMALHDAFHQRPLFSVKSKMKEETKSGFFETVFWPDQQYSEKHYVNHEVFKEERHQVVLTFQLDNAFWRNVSSVGLSNPTSTIWQTRPLSFMVDWLVSVDSVMASFDALNGLEFLSGSYGRGVFLKHLVKYAGTWRSSDDNPQSWTKVTSSSVLSQVGKWDIVSFRRTVYRDMPPPEFYFRWPLAGDSAGKAVTSIAVFRQKIDGLSRLRPGR